jgi:DMSO/TMAO reductase YedYZ molybdopterin-dependent catalytic subunit
MSDDPTPADSKLTTSKRRWASEGKFLTGRISRPDTDRLPPGQHLVKNWPVLDLGQQPTVSVDSWRLEVRGLVETPLDLNWTAFQELDQSARVSDIHCVTTSLRQPVARRLHPRSSRSRNAEIRCEPCDADQL